MEIWDGAMLSLGQLFTRNSMVASDLGEKAMVKSKFALFFNKRRVPRPRTSTNRIKPVCVKPLQEEKIKTKTKTKTKT